jgi:hypothetical protein
VFYNGKELEEEPGRDLESVLEYIDKLSSPSIIEIENQSEIQNFGKLYGESSFIMVYDDKNSEFYKCVSNLSENTYKTLFFIGSIHISKYTPGNGTRPFPALIVFKNLIY